MAQTGSGAEALTEVGVEAEVLSFEQALASVQSWANTYASARDIPDEHLPEVYDLRNINGNDFTSAVRDQEHCGSCYGLSFIQSIENRLRMKFGKDVSPLSVQ